MGNDDYTNMNELALRAINSLPNRLSLPPRHSDWSTFAGGEIRNRGGNYTYSAEYIQELLDIFSTPTPTSGSTKEKELRKRP